MKDTDAEQTRVFFSGFIVLFFSLLMWLKVRYNTSMHIDPRARNSPTGIDTELREQRFFEREVLGVELTGGNYKYGWRFRPEENGEVTTRQLTPDELEALKKPRKR